MEFSYISEVPAINEVKLTQFRVGLKHPLRLAGGRAVNVFYPILIEIFDEHNNYGVATIDNFYGSEYNGFGTAVTYEALRSHYIDYWMAFNRSIRKRTLFDHVLFLHSIKGANPFAISGIELALWDLIGRKRQKSIAELIWRAFFEISRTYFQGTDLGYLRKYSKKGIQARLPIGIHESITQYDRILEYALKKKISTVKIMISTNFEQVIHLIEHIRDVYPSLKIDTDANGIFNPSELLPMSKIINFYRNLDKFNIGTHEQPFPLRFDQVKLFRELQQEIKTPLCMDESIRSLHDINEFTRIAKELQRPMFCNVKIHRVGGLTQALRVLNHLENYNQDAGKAQVQPLPGTMPDQEPSAMCAATLFSLPIFRRGGDVVDHDYWFNNSIFKSSLESVNGRVQANFQKRGIGFDVDEEELKNSVVRQWKYSKNASNHV